VLVGVVLDRDRVREAILQDLNPALEQRLLVAGRVVLGVLVQVPELARDLDLVRDFPPPRPLELDQLGLETIRSEEVDQFGAGQAILVSGETLVGGCDARKDGYAAGF
jgi:hypothetical protein